MGSPRSLPPAALVLSRVGYPGDVVTAPPRIQPNSDIVQLSGVKYTQENIPLKGQNLTWRDFSENYWLFNGQISANVSPDQEVGKELCRKHAL
jgi:hypothetical protein